MKIKELMEDKIVAFGEYLMREEKSDATVEKYLHDVKVFAEYANGKEITKDVVLEYKRTLVAFYAARSVNSKLASLSSLFSFLGWTDCKVKSLRLQKQSYSTEDKELTKAEYLRLVQAAKNDVRLCLILETICSTGVRVSELRYFTLEAVRAGRITASGKNKTRDILIPTKLRKMLLNYSKKQGVTTSYIFRTRSGKPVNRSNIWAQMKALCAKAQVNPKKVFPHNLRKLFARTFYNIEKDIARLADILGHSSIDTTRIYIMTTCAEHLKRIEKLGLVVEIERLATAPPIKKLL